MIKKLLNLKLKFTKNQKGLTLIELLVVIVILGIIAAIAIPAITSQNDKAKVSAAEQTNAVIKDAAQRYAAVEKDYDGNGVTITMLGAKDYFQEAPECPDDTYTVAGADANLLAEGAKYCTK